MSKARELAELGAVYNSGALSNRNLIINGAMQVAQRATSSTGLGGSTGYFTVDRFEVNPGGTATAGRFTMSQHSDGPDGFANCLKLDCTTADTSVAAGERLILRHYLEGQNVQSLAKGTSSAKKVTVSFYVKGNAAATYACSLYDNDNGRSVSQTFAVTTSWNRIELTFPADTSGSLDDDNLASLLLDIFLHAGSDYTSGTLGTSWASNVNANRAVGISSFFDSTSREFFITGIQMEIGSEATPFEHRSFGDELMRCYRYYEEIKPADRTQGKVHDATNKQMHFSLFYKVRKRAVPSLVAAQSTISQLYDGTVSTTSFSGASFDSDGINLDQVTWRVVLGTSFGSGMYRNIAGYGITCHVDAEL